MSARAFRTIPFVLVVLGLAGFAIGSYLTIAHWGDQPIECGGVGDCGYVNSSEYASVGGVPVSALGAGLYLTMAFAAFAWRARRDVDWLPIAYWGLALAGAGYAGYLTYVELAVLHAVCVWCVTSAVLLAASLVLSTIALLGEPDAIDRAVSSEGDGPIIGTALEAKQSITSSRLARRCR
jgi:uncharacterized membrane protein